MLPEEYEDPDDEDVYMDDVLDQKVRESFEGRKQTITKKAGRAFSFLPSERVGGDRKRRHVRGWGAELRRARSCRVHAYTCSFQFDGEFPRDELRYADTFPSLSSPLPISFSNVYPPHPLASANNRTDPKQVIKADAEREHWKRKPAPEMDPAKDAIVFQQLDIDYIIGAPHALLSAKRRAMGHAAALRIFGVTAGGNSVCVHVHGTGLSRAHSPSAVHALPAKPDICPALPDPPPLPPMKQHRRHLGRYANLTQTQNPKPRTQNPEL
jgi:hypothetical protein